ARSSRPAPAATRPVHPRPARRSSSRSARAARESKNEGAWLEFTERAAQSTAPQQDLHRPPFSTDPAAVEARLSLRPAGARRGLIQMRAFEPLGVRNMRHN